MLLLLIVCMDVHCFKSALFLGVENDDTDDYLNKFESLILVFYSFSL